MGACQKARRRLRIGAVKIDGIGFHGNGIDLESKQVVAVYKMRANLRGIRATQGKHPKRYEKQKPFCCHSAADYLFKERKGRIFYFFEKCLLFKICRRASSFGILFFAVKKKIRLYLSPILTE